MWVILQISPLWELLQKPENIVYATVLGILLFIITAQILLLFIGISVNSLFEFGGTVDSPVEIDELAEIGTLSTIASFFQLGKVPFGLTFTLFAISFSMGGIYFNEYAHNNISIVKQSKIFIYFTIPITFTLAIVITKLFTNIWAHYLPLYETNVVSNYELQGQLATIISRRVTDQGGRAETKDPAGRSITVYVATVLPHPPIEGGTIVKLLKYDAQQNYFLCQKLPERRKE